AQRKQTKGFVFSTDTIWQQELEASFFFEDTPDQEKSIEAVKIDMESDLAMDRLICGDVGFGKTEVAIRAAFKAIVDGKQVAVLVPTTILTLQHFKTFAMRLKELPCTVDYISRFKSTRQQKDTLKRLAEGKIDIIIGTHRLASKDVKFKDLGLLIIDEEQKFGVGIKEKLRQMKPNVDTLTLTATPIPRTLQFSLMGARDISVINTPPPNRLPIHSEIQPLNMELIRKAILFEVNRNGQVFFINNRIQNIFEIQELLTKHIPEVKTIVAHGQMESATLEQIMYDFIDGEYDVLISTSIIESGLDIPNANTIIINNAHHFGLSDLHQLRGRVGRTNVKAFCYLITPPLNTLPGDTRRKLTTLVEFSELGSGFNIALQDLEIRGAGNLLGAEQSGFINEIGMETYQKILDEALIELKIEDKEIAKDIANQQPADKKYWVRDCIIDTDFQIMFPDEYINNSTERLKLYKELNQLTDEAELFAFHEQLIDRFGKLPKVSEDLLTLVKIRWLAMSLGISKIFLKNGNLRASFTNEPAFFQSEVFGNLLHRLSEINGVRLAEKNERALLIKENVANIQVVLNLFRLLLVGDVANDR
ncbi:MAG: DEAD/DEAH box helicase, partial [Bacteroidales bacterium]|nr:DEAD/DEAH box helicase [Bacteroidales bacterium]